MYVVIHMKRNGLDILCEAGQQEMNRVPAARRSLGAWLAEFSWRSENTACPGHRLFHVTFWVDHEKFQK